MLCAPSLDDLVIAIVTPDREGDMQNLNFKMGGLLQCNKPYWPVWLQQECLGRISSCLPLFSDFSTPPQALAQWLGLLCRSSSRPSDVNISNNHKQDKPWRRTDSFGGPWVCLHPWSVRVGPVWPLNSTQLGEAVRHIWPWEFSSRIGALCWAEWSNELFNL